LSRSSFFFSPIYDIFLSAFVTLPENADTSEAIEAPSVIMLVSALKLPPS
jgi:hypothetical protein